MSYYLSQNHSLFATSTNISEFNCVELVLLLTITRKTKVFNYTLNNSNIKQKERLVIITVLFLSSEGKEKGKGTVQTKFFRNDKRSFSGRIIALTSLEYLFYFWFIISYLYNVLVQYK